MTSLNRKLWKFSSEPPEEYIDDLQNEGIHPILAKILHRRGYTTSPEVKSFFAHYGEDDNPFRLKGMIETVYRLRMAIRNKEQIVIYGDFDADGVTSTALLVGVLTKLGADVRPYIPDRVDEGYGLNSPALKKIADDGGRVVVTVDCGIRSIQEVEDGKSYGLDMIISDHHSVGSALPDALAIINPKQSDCPYPEKMLAGVGLAYKIAQGIYMEATRRGYKADGWHPDDWLDLVAIGTVADIAPLRGENRMLVNRGLLRLNRPQRPGLLALYHVVKITPGQVSAMTIGFGIGPRINAAGRLSSAILAYDLLTSSDAAQATKLANQLDSLNKQRQQKTKDMQAWAEESMSGDPDDEPILFASDHRFEQGVVGLVASRLTDQYYRPSVVIHLGEEESHGSCRSIPEFNITRALEDCDDLLERYGGHAAAAGFTVLNENIGALQERLWEIAADQLADQELTPTIDIDTELPLNEATLALAEELKQLEPTGEANSPPLFVVRAAQVTEKQVVGADDNHLKLQFTDGDTTIEGIAFRWGALRDTLPDVVDLACRLEINEYRGTRRIQLRIEDFKIAGQNGKG